MNHFSKGTIDFLKSLKENNNKEWFEQNRDIYNDVLLLPMKHISKQLEPVMRNIDPFIETSPSVGKSVSKIYRDLRFSNDKTPYRTEAWVSFKRPKRLIENSPEFFLYFTTEEYQIGMGYYCSTPENMARYRRNVIIDNDEFSDFIDSFNSRHDIEAFGEEYKKKMASYLPEKFQPWMQKKTLYISRTRPIDELFYSEDIIPLTADIFNFSAKLYGFFINNVDDVI